MKNLFLELLHKQPSGQVSFGFLAKDGGKDGGTDYPPTKPPKKKILRPDGDFKISPEKRFFIGVFSENTGKEINKNIITQHLTNLQSLWNEDKLLFAGTYATEDRGLIIISAETIEEAGEIIKNDPVFQAGYYGKVDIEEISSFNPKTF